MKMGGSSLKSIESPQGTGDTEILVCATYSDFETPGGILAPAGICALTKISSDHSEVGDLSDEPPDYPFSAGCD